MGYSLLIFVVLAIIFISSLTTPRFIYWVIIVGSFFGMIAVGIHVKGFPMGLVEGLGLGILFALLAWAGLEYSFNLTLWYRALAEPKSTRRINSSIFCGKCKTKLSYFGTPKNFKQLMWGRRTCPNCGAELYNNGKVVSK